MNNERVTPKNAAKELQMDVITLRELMKREKLPIGYNGVEFLDMAGVERSATSPDARRTVAYYCHPYCSFERGSNENLNKMIRRHIPKGADIAEYSEEDVARIQDWMNDYPRAIFDGLSAREMLQKEQV